jgi:hypothetical protein
MSSLTFPTKTIFVLGWDLFDTQNPPQPVNGATMTATLYAGRSQRDPAGTPGTPVPPIVSLPLNFISNGHYQANVPGTLDPSLDGVGYVLVIDAQVASAQAYHFEQPVVVQTAGDSVDLTTVEAVKSRAEVNSSTDDADIQAAITGFSTYFLGLSGMSTLNSIVTLDEIYDGNGNNKLFLRTYPIRKINFVKIGPISPPMSPGTGQWGLYISTSKKYIGMRGGLGINRTFPTYMNWMNFGVFGGNGRGPVFSLGTGNIQVNYDAGNPDTPADLEWAVRCIVAINYKRKAWQDQAQRAVNAGSVSAATTTFRSWNWPPEYQAILDLYTRTSFIS